MNQCFSLLTHIVIDQKIKYERKDKRFTKKRKKSQFCY
jgi:hypothetical protein